MEVERDAKGLQLEDDSAQALKQKGSKNGFWVVLWRPVGWFRMLSEELHWSFVVGVVIIYGISQGVGAGLGRVSTQYYLKDEQKVQPSAAQVFSGIIQIPWIVKPLWGLFTDTVPVGGLKRKPYFVLAGFIGAISMLAISLDNKLQLVSAILLLMAGSAGIAIADVTIDACVTKNSISHPSLAGDMQTLCGLSSSLGALLGFSLSGFFLHLVGPKGVFGLLSIPPTLVIVVGLILRESKESNRSGFSYKMVSDKFVDAIKMMWTTIKCRDVYRPCLYMFLSIALGFNVQQGMFYWYTDAKDGPSFSQEVVGSIFSIGAIGSLVGVLIYQTSLKNQPFRSILLWTQLLFGASGLLDLVFVLRLNLKLGIPDYAFVVIDEAVSMMIMRIKWMPLLVLSSKLCPAGIEGTFFALLMSIDHVGMLTSSWAGGFVLHVLNVTRTKFDNLWLAVLLRSVMRVAPVGFLFLVPGGDPNLPILPVEMLRTKKGDDVQESGNAELVSLVGNA